MGYDLHRPMTLSPLRMYKQNFTAYITFTEKAIPECTALKNMVADKPRAISLKPTLIISGSASVSPVNRFLVLRNFLLLYLLSTVEEEVCENGL